MNSETEQLCRELVSGRVTRRRFIQRGLALGLSLSAIGGLLSACGGDEETGASPEASAAPVKGGIMRVGVFAPGTALNPTITIDSGAVTTMQQMLEYLCWADGSGNLRPVLAESWEPNGDNAAEWTFHLRQGVTWNDGKPFTADDVAWSMNTITDPDVGSNALSMLDGVLSKGGTAVSDESTVVFSLERPVGDFPYYVSQLMWNSMIIRNGFDPADIEKEPIGTGPFLMESFIPQQSASFTRNPNYWGADHPYLDGVEFTYYGEIPPQVVALQAHELDLLVEAPFQGAQALFSDPNLKIIWCPAAAPRALNMKVDHEPWSDKRVRQALALCLDRPAIVQALFEGYADLGNDHPFAPMYGFEIEVEQRTQDYAKAKQLLAEAGLPNGFKATLQSLNYLEIPQFLTMAKKMASEVGIDIELELMSMAEFYGTGDNMPWLETPFGCVDWASRGTVSQLILPAFHGDSDWNSANWKNEEYDSLLFDLDATADVEKRNEIANRMAAIQNDEVPWILPYWEQQARPQWPNVQDVTVNTTMHLDLTHAYLST